MALRGAASAHRTPLTANRSGTTPTCPPTPLAERPESPLKVQLFRKEPSPIMAQVTGGDEQHRADVVDLDQRRSAYLTLDYLADLGLLSVDSWKHVGLPYPPRRWRRTACRQWEPTAPTGTAG